MALIFVYISPLVVSAQILQVSIEVGVKVLGLARDVWSIVK